ncbi:hypothetical protein Clacol_008681 [Clathrus columnatus]|uniref:Short-chain dehydrogenase n=1 Tax=Clathrus columnatus TaxID=1419009 RepID=A0AAV5AID5_9AGAM|nr:hypothetical protein Clacol_008681 [Clathrus columnatus]
MSHLKTNVLFDISGFVAVVTGGGTGIGLMIAKGLASNGARVYITGRRKEVLDKAAKLADQQEYSGSIIPFVADVVDKQSILSLVEHIEKEEGKLHLLVNNAGQVGPTAPFFSNPSAPECEDTATLGRALFDCQDFNDWADLYSLLEKGTKDIGRGFMSSIINITSISGVIKLSQNHFAYNSAKAAVTHITKMLATELGLRKIPIRVNAIAPGAWPSEMTSNEGNILNGDKANRISMGIQKLPADRGGTEEEIAASVLYLASRAGSYITGQEIIIDGGYVAVNPATS